MTFDQYIKKYRSLIITLILIIVPLLGTFIFMISGKTYDGTDIAFHYQRYLELRFDIGHGILPQFMTHAGSPLGDAENIFYPYETLVPFILLTWFIHRPIDLVYGIFYLIWVAIAIGSYFSAKIYFHSRKTGLIFSILYTACSTVANAILLNDDIGQSLSYIWMPLILFGFLGVLKNGHHYLMLSLGLSGIIMSHVLTTILMAVILIILGVCNLKRIITHLHILMGYIKSIMLTLMMSAIFWIPIIYTMQRNSYFNPKYGSAVTFWMSGLLHSQSGEFIHENCGFIDGVGIIIGLVAIISIPLSRWLRKRSHISIIDWEIWLIGILYWLCNANIKPLQNLFSTPALSEFQFSFRTALPIHICFTYIAVKWLAGYYDSRPLKQYRIEPHYKRIVIGLCIFFALFMQIGNQINEEIIFHQRAVYYSTKECSYVHQMSVIEKHHPQGRGLRLDNNSFKYMRNTDVLQDYEPINVTTMSHYKFANAIGQHYLLTFKQQGRILTKPVLLTRDGVKFTTHQTLRDVSLPLIWYRGYGYNITNNHKTVNWKKNPYANFVEIPKIKPGNYLFQIHPQINKNTQEALIISLVGWLSFIFYCMYELVKLKNYKNAFNINN